MAIPFLTNTSFSAEITVADDINASTKIVIGEGASPELRLKKTEPGSAKVSFYSANVQKSYLDLDASEDMVYYAGANVRNVFFAGGVLNEIKTGANSVFSGNVDVNGTHLRFKSTGAAFIDHNTVAQSIKFRLSSSSSLDVTPLEITPSYASFANVPFVGTMAAGDNSTRAASTAFVTTAVATGVGDYLPLVAGSGSPLTGTLFINGTNDLVIANGSLTSSQSSTTNPVARFTNTGVNNYDWVFPDSTTLKLRTNVSFDAAFKLINEGSGDFNFQADTGNFLNKVGIGMTTTPDAKLEVRHATYANTNETAIFTNGNRPVRVTYDTVVVAQTDVPCLSIIETPVDNNQATEQKLTFAVGDGSAVIGSSSTVANGIYINTNRTTNAAGYLTTNGTNVAKFQNDGSAIFPGNVGIGKSTSLANHKLSILKASNQQLGLYYDETHVAAIGAKSNADLQIYAWNGSSYRNILLGVDGGAVGGNVGIGTVTPGEKLEVNGVIQIKRSGDHPAIRFIEDSGTGGAYVTRGYIGVGDWAINGGLDADLGIASAGTGSLILGTNSGQGRVYIINGGNVGIGVTGPGDKLEIGNLNNYTGLTVKGVGASRPAIHWKNVTQSLLGAIYGTETRDMIIETGGDGSTGTVTMTLNSAGSVRLNAYNSTNKTGVPSYILGTDSSGNVVKVLGADIPGTPGGSGTENFLARWTPDNDTLGIGVTFDNGTNVGIGTITPDARLHIYGSTSLSEMYLGEDGATDKAGILKYTQGDGTGTGVITLSHYGNTSTTQSLAIKYGGNVGIGTTSPNHKLQVEGGSAESIINLTTTGYANGLDIIQGTDGHAALWLRENSYMHFATNSVERMRINSDGDVLMGNTVVNPASNFSNQKGFAYKFSTGQTEIANTGGETLTLGRNIVADGNILVLRKQATVIGVFGSNTAGGDPLLDIASAPGEDSLMRFLTSGIERLRIDKIGLATFRSTYVIAGYYGGEVTLGGSDTTFGLQLKYTQDASTTSTLYHSPGYANSQNLFKLGSGSGNTNQLVLKGDGNIGIGVANPERVLHLDANQGRPIIQLDKGGDKIFSVGTGSSATNADDTILQMFNEGTETVRIFTEGSSFFNGGNVGIGVTGPLQKLVVQDGDGGGTGGSGIDSRTKLLINANTESYISVNVPALSFCGNRYMIAGTTKASVELYDYAAGPQFRISSVDSRPLVFATTNAEKMRISPGGSVGIGTDNPQSQLQVAGGIQMADDTNAGTTAAKAGTMRYRTGTEYIDVTGTELVTNGNFNSATGWTAQSGWAISGGKANGTTTTDSIYQSISAITASTKYRLIYTISGLTAGSVRVSLRAAVTTTQTTNGTFTEIVTSGTSADTNFYIDAVASFTGSIDNVSLVEVTEEDASYADMCMQTGASTYEWVNIVRNTY